MKNPLDFVCPDCGESLSGAGRSGAARDDREFRCGRCGTAYPVVRGIPRFVEEVNYADSFSFQWNTHARTQIDRFNGTQISEERFFKVTGWPGDLSGQKILEPGCGAGRFSQIALQTGAELYSFDYSGAVDASKENHGKEPRLHLFQADIYKIPLPKGVFDKIFCFGVLQHCPDPKKAFLSLVPFLKPGGEIVVDVYQLTPRIVATPKYWLRPLTKRLSKETLYNLVSRTVPPLIPVKARVRKIPVAGRYLAYLIPIACYKDILPLTERQVVDWGILDTFDMLSPRYDRPQTIGTVRRWFAEAGLNRVDVRFGPNGINGKGTRPR